MTPEAAVADPLLETLRQPVRGAEVRGDVLDSRFALAMACKQVGNWQEAEAELAASASSAAL